MKDPKGAGSAEDLAVLQQRIRELEAELARFQRVDEALWKDRSRLRHGEVIAGIGYWEFSLGAGTALASEGARLIYGLSGRDWRIAEIQKIPLPECRAQLDEAMRALIAGEKPYDVEFKIRRPSDGKIRDIHSIAEYDPEQRVIFGVLQDITERKQVEETLRISEGRLRIISAMISDIAYSCSQDASGAYVINWMTGATERVTGYAIAEILARQCWKFLVVDEDLPLFEANILGLESGMQETCELRIRHKDGSVVWLASHAECIQDPKSPGSHILYGSLVDVTARRLAAEAQEKLQTQLTQAMKMESIGRLAGGVAHDFNNMLGVILGRAELALVRLSPQDPLRGTLQEIRDAAQRSSDLTRQLLAFARRQTVTPKVLDLNDVVKGMLEMLRRLIGEDIDLAWRPGNGVWPVRLDPTQVDQMLANLCVNARDAISGVGKVIIETRNVVFDETTVSEEGDVEAGEYVLLAVSDDGCGMSPETLSHLFEPFFTTKDIGRGTGLGLATVYGIIKQNRGFVNVYSEPAHGTIFRIYFPRAEADSGQPRREETAYTPTGGNETILLVEDEPAILTVAKIMLEEQGYSVITAANPGEAIRLAGDYDGSIHLLVTDVIMPEMNGKDLSDRLMASRPALKCLFMSGYTANVIAHRGILDEGVHFLAKPFLMKELMQKVREALGHG